jgi:hypothetical protein
MLSTQSVTELYPQSFSLLLLKLTVLKYNLHLVKYTYIEDFDEIVR